MEELSLVEAWAVDQDRFIGSNEEFGLTHLPHIRSAFLACNCDQLQITKLAGELDADSLLHEVSANGARPLAILPS